MAAGGQRLSLSRRFRAQPRCGRGAAGDGGALEGVAPAATGLPLARWCPSRRC